MTKLAAFTQLLSNVMWLKCFLSGLILTLKKKNHSKEKSLHRHTISSFASPKSLFAPQLGSRETPFVFHLYTEDQHCPPGNQLRAAPTVWDQCGSTTTRRDFKRGGHACSSRWTKSFLPDRCRSEHSRPCLPSPPWKLSRRGVTLPSQPPGEWEGRIWRPFPLGANLILANSRVAPWYSYFPDRERSLDPGR